VSIKNPCPKDSILNKCPSLVAILDFQSTHKKKLVRGRRYECEKLTDRFQVNKTKITFYSYSIGSYIY
jgi:hypothetical protein